MIITLKSSEIELQLVPNGASIYQIKTKNKNGEYKNICLAHQDLTEYADGNGAYFGATCGRFGGRIKDAKFNIDGKTYELDKNSGGKHSLHGGLKGFSRVAWEYEVIEEGNVSKCVFTHSSPHLEDGFPGNVEAKVEYILEGNTITLNYYCTSDMKTYLNLTNHSYFNLSDGESEDIQNHLLQLNSTKYLSCDTDVIPTGLVAVDGTEYDFRDLKTFGELGNKKDEILKAFGGFDNCFALDKESGKPDLYLKDEKSGRTLKIETTYPCVVLYTYNSAGEEALVGRENIKHIGVAIEPQYAPNAMNDDRFFIPVVDAENPYKETIKYTFNV